MPQLVVLYLETTITNKCELFGNNRTERKPGKKLVIADIYTTERTHSFIYIYIYLRVR